METLFINVAKGFIQMWRKSNYDWMLSLTSTIAFTRDQTHDFVFTKPML